MDSAVRKKLVQLAALIGRVESLGAGHYGAASLRRLAQVRKGLRPIESVPETLLFRLIRKSRLPAPTPQFDIRRHDGSLLARVDFAFPRRKVAVEFDSYEFHANRRTWARDRLKDNLLRHRGWVVLRFTYADLKNRPDFVLSTIRLTLAQSGVLGPT